MTVLEFLSESLGITFPSVGLDATNKFVVSEFINNTDTQKLLESDNYFDQYIGWTYKAVTIKADAASMIEPRLYRKTTRSKTDEIFFDDTNLPGGQMLHDYFRFNKYQSLSEARALIYLHLGLAGIAFVYMKKGLYSHDFFVLNPEKFTIITDSEGLPVAYKFEDVNGHIDEIPSDNILCFRNPNPKNWLKGWSPVFASKYAHNSWQYASETYMNNFQNQGRMQGILTFLNVGPAERRRIERTLRDKYMGPKNAGKIATMDVKPDWTPIGSSMVDLQFVEGIKLMREEILSIQGVPEPLAVSASTFNNVAEAKKIFAEYTVDPMLKREASVLTEQLIPRYYPKNSNEIDKLYIEFPSTIPVDTKEVNESFEKGTMKLNEARRMQKLGDDPENGDKYFWQLQIATPAVPVVEEEKKLKPSTQKKTKLSGASREQFRVTLLEKLIKEEDKFEIEMKKFFRNQKQRVLESTKRFKDINLKTDIDLEQEIALTINTFKDLYAELGIDFNNQASELLGKDKPLSKAAQKELADNLEYFATEINKTTQKDLQELLSFAIENNLGLKELRENIKDLFDRYNGVITEGAPELKVARAEAIARTETNKIKNGISYRRYRTDSDVEGYEWLATGGAGSRESHNRLDGKVIKKGEKFNVGGFEASYPHASSLPAKHVVNCRCDILPVLKQG